MNTTIILIIAGVVATALVIFLVTRNKKSTPPKPLDPVRPPVPEPPKPPQPDPPRPDPIPEPKPVYPALPTITMPPAPPMPDLPDEVDQSLHIYADGADLGAAIMSAQGGGRREIIVDRSGELRTPVILKPHTRLRLEPGVEIRSKLTDAIPFRLMEHTSIVGGEGSVIYENESGRFEVVTGYYGTERNGDPDFDIHLYGFEVRGSNRPDFWSAAAAVYLCNGKNCSATKLFINGTHSIGLAVGGNAQFGHSAEDVKVSHCRFERVASQSLALVNGRRITFEYCEFYKPGQLNGPGSHPIDLELNNSDDVLYDVLIRGMMIDFRDALQNGNGLIVQVTTGSQEIGKIRLEDIVIIGGNPFPPDITNWASSGIYCFGQTLRDVRISNCDVWRTGHGGLTLEGKDIFVENVRLVNCGGGGIPGATLNSVTGGLKNVSYVHTGHGPGDGRMLLINSEVTMDNVTGFGIVKG